MKITKEDLNKMHRADEHYKMMHGDNKKRCAVHKSRKEYRRKEKHSNSYEE